MQVNSPEAAAAAQGALGSTAARKALAGFFVSGLLLAFPGAILPCWGYDLSSYYLTIFWYFVGMIAGVLASVWASPPLLQRKGIGWTLAFGCLLASAALLYLAFVSPPFASWWRVGGMAMVGL